jgi:hypothetical protein
MRPSVVLLGFLLGSSAAISFSLAGVAVVFVLLRPEYPRLDDELGPLLGNLALFLALTAAAGVSFYGALRGARWRRAAFVWLALTLVVVMANYWPD